MTKPYPIDLFKTLLIGLALALSCATVQAQTMWVQGKVVDYRNNEALPGANLWLLTEQKGTISQSDGSFGMAIQIFPAKLVVSYVGYRPDTLVLPAATTDTTTLNIRLRGIELAEVEITAANSLGDQTNLSRATLSAETARSLPAFFGEVDLLKTLQLLPGVSNAGEGNSGLYVRGGSPDQNLVLIDGAPVYNASHLFGFFSVFNSDAVDEVTLTKGGMPARYGGRLASVLEVEQKSGDADQWTGSGGVGLIASRLTVGGPLVKDKLNLTLSGRRTYIDVLARPLIDNDPELAGSGYFFYDLNGKLDWTVNSKNRISLSGYYGRDAFRIASEESGFNSTIRWGNQLGVVNWTYLHSPRLVVRTKAYHTAYSFSFGGGQSDFTLNLLSEIRDYAAQSDLTWSLSPRHTLRAGVSGIYHNFTPRNVSANQQDTDFSTGTPESYRGIESGIYLEDAWKITDGLTAEGGVRFSAYSQFGPFTRYRQRVAGINADTIRYAPGEHIVSYSGLEPRLALRQTLGARFAAEAAYTRNYQYIQLASLSPLALPTDVWLSSSEQIRPQLSDQWNAGVFYRPLKGGWEASAEAYYKDMQNLLEYRENTSPQDGVGNNEDNLLTAGIGRSYGIEMLVRKTTGKVTGWVGYTLARTERQFDEINGGEWFPAFYDRRHDLSVVALWQASDRVLLGATFVYATGNAITLPESRFLFENEVVAQYGERNSFRMPPYHRMDVSLTLRPKAEKRNDPNRKVHSEWVFSVYNLYSRLNPYFYYFGTTGSIQSGDYAVEARQVSLFPILPSATWNFRF